MTNNELENTGLETFEEFKNDEKPWTHEYECGFLEDLAKITEPCENGFGCHPLQAFEYYFKKFNSCAVITEYEYHYSYKDPTIYVNQLGAYTDIHYLAKRCRNWIYNIGKNTFDYSASKSISADDLRKYFKAYLHDDGFSVKVEIPVYDESGNIEYSKTQYELRITTVSFNQGQDSDGFEPKIIQFSNDIRKYYL